MKILKGQKRHMMSRVQGESNSILMKFERFSQRILVYEMQKRIHLPNYKTNKKVLLRERKRHTARRVSSARYAAHGMGTPRPSRPGRGGYLGTPCPDLGWGTPLQTWDGVPPPHVQTWDGVPLSIQTWHGVPPLPRPGTGYPPLEVWTDKQTENSTFPHPSDADDKNKNA